MICTPLKVSNLIISISPVKYKSIYAVSTKYRVISEPTANTIVAGIAKQQIIASATIQGIIAGIAMHDISETATQQIVVRCKAKNIGHLNRL